MTEAAILVDAERCTNLWIAVVERARRDARGVVGDIKSHALRPHVAAEARDFLAWLRRYPGCLPGMLP